jgi:restriction system protein
VLELFVAVFVVTIAIRVVFDRRARRRIQKPGFITPEAFEELAALLLRRGGWSNVKRVGGPNDGGVDVVGTDRFGKYGIVQCKRYSVEHKVGSPVVQALIGARVVHGADRALLLTTSSFTHGAEVVAGMHGIELYDGRLLDKVVTGRKSPIV